MVRGAGGGVVITEDRMSPMKQRRTRQTAALSKLGADRVTAFLRWSRRRGGVLACRLINARLDVGETLDKLFRGPIEHGFFLKAKETEDGEWEIEFGCHASPDAGDGGTRRVCFDTKGTVRNGRPMSQWIA
jgi:hypothetical protein